VTSAHIDISRLSSLIEGIWTIDEAQNAFSADFTKPVSSDIKKQLWQIIQIAKMWRHRFPAAKVEKMKFVHLGTGVGGLISKPGSGSGGGG
jgi:hypothetical protein